MQLPEQRQSAQRYKPSAEPRYFRMNASGQVEGRVLTLLDVNTSQLELPRQHNREAPGAEEESWCLWATLSQATRHSGRLHAVPQGCHHDPIKLTVLRVRLLYHRLWLCRDASRLADVLRPVLAIPVRTGRLCSDPVLLAKAHWAGSPGLLASEITAPDSCAERSLAPLDFDASALDELRQDEHGRFIDWHEMF